jgi:mycothiol synthase
MRLVEVIRRPTRAELSELVAFVDGVAEQTGVLPLSDHLWLDLQAGGADGFLAVRIADATGSLALAQVSAGNDASSLEVVVRPGLDDGERVRDDALETAVDMFDRVGGGALHWWVDDPTGHDRAVAERFGMAPVRELFEMRRPLPADRHASVSTRDFDAERDVEAWLHVNNRAFAEHTEQGGWTRETFAKRAAEPWFDPTGFRLHERDGRLAGFCWTKLHTDRDPVIGEIYVIAVDPDFHGIGLGTELTLAGLDAITSRGVSMASLYVDAGNTAAVRVYDRLGFTVHHARTAFAAVRPDRGHGRADLHS